MNRHTVPKWKRKKMGQLYALYNRLNSALWTYIGSGWKDGKKISMQTENKIDQGNYTYQSKYTLSQKLQRETNKIMI